MAAFDWSSSERRLSGGQAWLQLLFSTDFDFALSPAVESCCDEHDAGWSRHALSRLLLPSSKTSTISTAPPPSPSSPARWPQKSGGTGVAHLTPSTSASRSTATSLPRRSIICGSGLKYRPGENVGIGRDFTLYAKAGWVEFMHRRLPKPTSWIRARGHEEEHMTRVAKRVEMRKTRGASACGATAGRRVRRARRAAAAVSAGALRFHRCVRTRIFRCGDFARGAFRRDRSDSLLIYHF